MLKKTMFIPLLLVLLAVSASPYPKAAWPTQAQETESRIPELDAYHDIIYPIWHTAYPEKDYAALRKYAPEVRALAEKIFGAALPGILRDREAKWKDGLALFKKSVDDYAAAAAGNDDAALLAAAEALHAKYEALNRIISPVLKEMDEFHKAFYVVFHKDLVEKNYSRIKAVSGDLKAKAEAVAGAVLPKRLEAKSGQFKAAAAELVRAAIEFESLCRAGDEAGIEAAVDKLHAKYQDLEKLFS